MKKVSNKLKHVFAAFIIIVFALSTILASPQVTSAFTVSYSRSSSIVISDENTTSPAAPTITVNKPQSSGTVISSVNTAYPDSLTLQSTPSTFTYRPITISINGSSYTYFSISTTSFASVAPVKIIKSQPEVEKKVIASGTKYATDLYIIRSGKPGPVVMIVGGVHGNEPAGYKAADIIKYYSIEKGTLLVLPQANKRAIDINKRYVSGEGDLNRDFPQTKYESPDNTLSKAIYNTVKTYDVDWLMDMHEGYDYYKNTSTDSVGQSLIYYPANSTKTIVSKIISELNKGISSSYREFSLLRYPVSGSLARSTGEFLGVHSFIFETCTKQTLSTRINYQLEAANTLLKELEMK